MRLVGLDLSLTSTGVALAPTLDIPEGTAVFRPKALAGMARIAWLRRRIMPLCWDADLVVIEDYAFSRQASRAHALGELGGAIRLALFDADVRYVDVAPTTRAKYATGKGNSGKAVVVSSVSAKTGRTFAYDDEVDAFVLREMALAQYGQPCEIPPTNQAQRDALAAVEWPDLREPSHV